MIAFLSNVNEDYILNGEYNTPEEEERVYYAAQVIKNSPIYVEELPDFSLQDIENKIKKNLREHDINYVFYDYIHTSIKILEEITRRSGGVKLREDNILFMLSTKIKDICKQYDVFIISATQLNSDYQESKTPDQNLLRGAKSIADKIDVGMIILPVTEQDRQSLESLCGMNGFPVPKLKISIYKNRRGKYKGVLLWCEADLGTCRVEPIFCTDYTYQLIDIPNLKIIMQDEESAF